MIEFINEMLQILVKILNYKILMISNNPITASNILISSSLAMIGFKLLPLLENRIAALYIKAIPEDRTTRYILEKMTKYLLVWIFILIILDFANIPIKTFTFITGAFGLGIGFGTKDIIYNFCSGIIIIITKPIKLGDFIDIGEYRGTVQAINIRYIVMRSLNDIDILVPNGKILESVLINWTLSKDLVAMHIKLKSSKLSLIPKIEKDLIEILNNIDNSINTESVTSEIDTISNDEFIIKINYFIDIIKNHNIKFIKNAINRKLVDYSIDNGSNIEMISHEIEI